MALSLLAMVFTAVPTNAAVYYTGSIETTDDTGDAKTTFIKDSDGTHVEEHVYVSVYLEYMGEAAPVSDTIMVRLMDADGHVYQSITNDTTNGTYDSWESPYIKALNTENVVIDGEFAVVDVVAYVVDGMIEFARTQIIVLEDGLFLDPPAAASPYWDYYPGQEITITLVTTQTADFYIQVVNETFVDYLNWSNQEATDNYWTGDWVIPDDIPDGTYDLNIRSELDDEIWYSATLQIQAYILEVDSDRSNYLPGEDAEINYRVVEIATLDINAAVTIEWNQTYTNESGNETYDWGTFVGASGVEIFPVPEDIALYSWVDLHFYANDTQGRSAEAWVTLDIGLMSIEADLDEGPYAPGDNIEMEAWVYCGGEALPDAEVEISVTKDDVTISAYGADGLLTNREGGVYHSFDLTDAAGLGTYLVEVNATKLGFSVSTMVVFHVIWEAEFSVHFDKDSYYSGENATLWFEAKWNGEIATGYPILYRVYLDGGVTLLKIGNSNGSDVYVNLPTNYVGDLDVYAEINIEGYVFFDTDDSEVAFATVIVTPLADYYRPGETVTFVYEIQTGITTGTLGYMIVDEDDHEVDSSILVFGTSGMFDFVVPDEASSEYTATLKLQDGLGRVATGSATVELLGDYELTIWLETDSKYMSGAYKPGDTLTFGFEILVYNEDADVQVFRIEYGTWLDEDDQVLVTTALSGEFEYVIPEHVGTTEIYLSAYLSDATEDDWWVTLSYDEVLFNTDASLTGWDTKVAGMSAIDFTILLLIIIMILLLIIVPFLKGRSGRPKPAKVEEPEPELPPAAPPEKPSE